MLVPQHVDGLESGVIVHDDERVVTSSVYGWKEGSGDVHVNKAAGMRGLVQIVGVRQALGIGFSAGRARRRRGMAQALWCVCSEIRELFESCSTAVKPPVHVLCGFVGDHYLNV
eukprot:6088574-Pleurochrysis_carterae.AAC.3